MSRNRYRVASAALLAAVLALSSAVVVGAPAATAAPDPGSAPLIVGAKVASGSKGSAGALDLTQAGGVDWVHMTGAGIDRKNGSNKITVENLKPDQPIGTFSDSPFSYRWTDGTPTENSTGVTTGAVFNYDRATTGPTDNDAGYQITIPAADTVRKAVLVGGVWQAKASITVSTLTDTKPLFATESSATGNARVHLYTITLRPGQGAIFTAKLSSMNVPDGNVSLGAVAVGEVPVEADNLTLSSQTIPAAFDLTEQGPLDWLHLDGPNIEQAQGGSALAVTNRNPDRAIATQSDNPVVYRWTNGTTVAEQAGTRHGGVFLASNDDFTQPSGFDLSIAADSKARTLQFISGVWQASAKITVTVNGDPTVVQSSDELTAGGSAVTRLFVLTLRPGDSAVVSAQLTGRNSGNGNVTLGAATLAARAMDTGELSTLLDTIAAAELSEANEAARQQLDREVQAARALIGEPSPNATAVRQQIVMLRAAFQAALDSASDVQYTFQTNPDLVSSFGWEGDRHAPIAYIDGSYLLRDRGQLMVTFGVPDIPGKIDWRNAEGYLPAFISTYSKRGLDVSIQSFSDEAIVDGNRFEVAYSRMTVTNTTDAELPLPVVSSHLVPLNDGAATKVVAPGKTVVRDYAIAADRFNGTYAWPSTDQVKALGAYDDHYAHMRDYWNERLAGITDITELPNPELVNAYKAGFIYTLIIRDDIDGQKQLHVGENGYDVVFDHDTIGIVAALLTTGDFTYAKDYLSTLPAQLQYDDAKWKYSWPFALYLQRTGDKDFIRAEFENIKTQTHKIETDRIDGGAGIMKETYAIDSNGYWTIDNWSALAGLTTYKYLAEQLGEDGEAHWAKTEYDDLYRVVTERLQQTIDENDLDYIPMSMVEANEDGPRADPRDANWASMFLFGRWAWDGYLFGAEQSGLMVDWIDQSYQAGFDRRAKISDSIYNFGGYPHGYYSSAYNAGYGSTALRGEEFRDAGIRAYEFMINKAQSGPFGWWEGVNYPNAESPWAIDHAAGGGGSNQHMWGQSTATKVLFDSLIAQKSDGTVLIGRGVPNDWIAAGEKIALKNYPVQNAGRVGYSMSSTGTEITVDFAGDTSKVEGFSIELIGLKDNIASVSVPDAVIDQGAGTVLIPSASMKSGRDSAEAKRVVIKMKREIVATGDPLAASINGKAVSGQTLSAAIAEGWTATSYQWLRNGEPIAGATKGTFVLTSADIGAKIAVRVSGSRPGWSDATVTSAEVGPVVAGADDPNAGAGKGTGLAVTGINGLIGVLLVVAALGAIGVGTKMYRSRRLASPRE